MTRKRFIGFLGIAILILLIPAVGITSNGFLRKAILSLVRKDLGFLKIDPSGLNQFVDDLLVHMQKSGTANHYKLRLKILGAYLRGQRSSNSETVHYLSSKFLMSSDFFVNKMDESKLISYRAFYDPYQLACSNPFTHLYYPSSAAS